MSIVDDKACSVPCETQNIQKGGKSAFDELPREELVKQAKKQLFLLQKTKTKCDALAKQCADLEKKNKLLKNASTNETLSEDRSSKEELKSKIQTLWKQFVAPESNENQELPLCRLLDDIQEETSLKFSEKESKICSLQEELNKISNKQNLTSKSLRRADEQIQCMQMKLDTLTITCQCLQEDMKSSHELNKELKDEVNVLTAARDTALKSMSSLKEKLSTQNSSEIQNLTVDIQKLKQQEEVLVAELDECKRANLSQCEEYEILMQQNNELKKDISSLLADFRKSTEENVILNSFIDEYKNEKIKMMSDIGKLQSLCEEFSNERKKFCETDEENKRLKEELCSKGLALDEFNYQVEVLISSIKQGTKQKNASGGFKTEKEPMQNISILIALYDEISSRLKSNTSQTSYIETELESLAQEKRRLGDELSQVKDLNQFLEDEIKSTMEENEQLKSELKSCEANMENDALHISKLEAELQEALDRERNHLKISEKCVLGSKNVENCCQMQSETEEAKVFEPTVLSPFCYSPGMSGNMISVAIQACVETCDISAQVCYSSESFFTQSKDFCKDSILGIEKLLINASVQTEHIVNESLISIESENYISPVEVPDCNDQHNRDAFDQSSEIEEVESVKRIQSLEKKLSEVEINLEILSDKYVFIQEENKHLVSENQSIKEKFENYQSTAAEKGIFKSSKMGKSIWERQTDETEGLWNKFSISGNENDQNIPEYPVMGRSLWERQSDSPTVLWKYSATHNENYHNTHSGMGEVEPMKMQQSLWDRQEGSTTGLWDLPNKFSILQTENDYNSHNEIDKAECEEIVLSLKQKLSGAEASLEDFSIKLDCLQEENKRLLYENENLREEFDKALKMHNDLKQTLESKSLLLEGVHVQMDSLLSQIEDLNEEIKVKECDLEAAHKTNSHLKTTLNQLSNLTVKKQSLLSSAYDLVNILKEQKSQMVGDIDSFKMDFSNVFQDASNTVCNVARLYNNCYSSLNEHKKVISEREAEIVNLKNGFSEIEFEVSAARNFFKTNLFERREKLKSFVSWADDQEVCLYSSENASSDNLSQVGHDLDKSSEQQPFVMRKDRSVRMVQHIKKEMESVLNIMNQLILENEKNFEELSNCRISVVPNLEKIISNLELQLRDHQSHIKQEELKQLSTEENEMELSKEDSNKDVVLLKKQLSEMEIKMTKLKAVALKAKRELAETKKKYEGVMQEKDDNKQHVTRITHELDRVSSVNLQYAQNFQSLQIEYDKLQDDCEELKSKLERLEGDLSSSLGELNANKEKCVELQRELDKSQNSLSVSVVEKEAEEKKVVELESKIIILESTNNDNQKKVESLHADLSKSQKEMKDITEEHKAVKQQLNGAMKEKKKHSLLDLEMADYERSISELNSQLLKKCADIEELQIDMNDLVAKNNSLQENMNHVESQRETEERRADNLKEILEKTKSELSAVRNQEAELKCSVENLKLQVESLTLQGEDYKLQLSQASAEIEALKESIKSSAENHQRIVRSLDTKVNVLQQECAVAHRDVENANQEFENYKIRVHSVLKQQKQTITPFSQTEDESKENLQKLNEKLKLQVVDMGEKLRIMVLESESLQEEHENLLQRHGKLVDDLENVNQNWNERLDKVIMEKNQLQSTQEELTAQHSKQTSILTTSFTKQIRDLQEKHKFEIDDLQKQLDSSDIEISRLQIELTKVPALVTTSVQDDAIPFDMCLQERQEGEGSECTDEQITPIRHLSLATIPTTGFLPLEKLLQSPIEPETSVSYISNPDSERLDADLNSSYRKIDHLSELLNESEANNFRLIEQVRVLKEEVRRLERNKEREEHAENLEYLKNIFVKFSTLQTGDEKSRLVPVLTTMLKLSPLEQQQLRAAAGEFPEPNTSSGGWGNYIPRWSGLM